MRDAKIITAAEPSTLRARVSVASVFTSAFLLFLLQPMLARVLLPVYGGSPAVWNTCMVFFQVLLLGGYAYANAVSRGLTPARQLAIHGALLIVSLLALPRAAQIAAPDASWPVPGILLALLLLAGLPFFVLSTNSSLTQHWFASGAEKGVDPSWLYAASNTGSLAALVCYPLVVEPWLGVAAQLRWWSIAYVAFVVLAGVSMYFGARGSRAALAAEVVPTQPVARARKVVWVLHSAVATSLLLSVTMQITTDVVSAPLLWVLPLALYLLTFIIVFSRGRRPPRPLVARVTAIGIAISFVLVIVPTMFPLWFALLALLATLFAGALLCHGDLADDRPQASELSAFYLWISVGGVIGGVLNSVVAPLVFDSVAELPITLAALAWLLTAPGRRVAERLRALIKHPAAAAMVVVIATAALVAARQHVPVTSSDGGLFRWQFTPVALLAFGVLFASRPDVFAVAASLSTVFVIAGLHFVDSVVDRGRSFFGVSRVTENAVERLVLHGVTVHGSQRKDPAVRDVPTSYYDPDGPLGWVVSHAPPGAAIGIIGLGAGSLAPLAQPGQSLSFYEIDPLVERMAREDFTYLSSAKAATRIHLGDGRRLLDREPNGRFDLLVIDAFNSDAIPTHC